MTDSSDSPSGLSTPRREAIRVLHVDDDPQLVELSALFLESETDGFVVETETRTRDALDRLSVVEFDCLVSEFGPSGVDGREFLRRVRRIDPDLPVLLYTWQEPEDVVADGLPGRVAGYLRKSTGTDDYEVLAARIEDVVDSRG